MWQMSDLIDRHISHMRAQGLSKRTIDARRDLLQRLDHLLPRGLHRAATDELDAFLGSDPDWSRWTRATYAMHIRCFYRWATAVERLDGDPSIDMGRPRTPKCLPNPVTDNELAAALDRSDEPWVTVILLAAYAGLRVSEIARLDRADITQDAIRVVGKGGDPQLVDTHPRIWAHIRGRPPGPLLSTSDGQQVSGRWISAHARHHFDAIGLPGVHMHRFRHWFATTLLANGASMRTVQEAGRWASITSAEIYTKVRNGQRRLAIRSLPAPRTPRALQGARYANHPR